jgi:hypothetical protein
MLLTTPANAPCMPKMLTYDCVLPFLFFDAHAPPHCEGVVAICGDILVAMGIVWPASHLEMHMLLLFSSNGSMSSNPPGLAPGDNTQSVDT